MKFKTLDITPGQRLEEAIAWAADRPDHGPINVPRCAVAERRIGLTTIFDHRATWTPRAIASNIPRIVLISDDCGESRDPSEWRCAISVMAWSKTSVVHDTGAQGGNSRTALFAAEITGRSFSSRPTVCGLQHGASAIQPR